MFLLKGVVIRKDSLDFQKGQRPRTEDFGTFSLLGRVQANGDSVFDLDAYLLLGRMFNL